MRLVSELVPLIMAVDPGGTTGVAWLVKIVDAHGVHYEFGSAEVPDGRFGFIEQFHRLAEVHVIERLIVEDFIINSGTVKKTQQVDPWRLVGYLEGWAHQHGVPLVLQTPSTAKGFGSDEKLKFLGWHRPSKGGHANDAARHLLVGTRDLESTRKLLLEFAQS